MNNIANTQQNVFFSIDQEAAAKAGGSDFINEGGAYSGIITKALCVQSGKKRTDGIELSFEDKTGLKVNYVTLYYRQQDGSIVKSGHNSINALMAIMGIQNLTYTQDNGVTICPELVGKPVGLCLQKGFYTKQDGADAYKFDLRFPFDPATNLTVKEKSQNLPAKSVDLFVSSYKDKDERQSNQQQSQNQSQGNGGYANEQEQYGNF